MRDYDVVDETTAEDGTPFRVVIEQDPESGHLDPRRGDSTAGVIVAQPPDSRHWAPQEDAETVPAWRVLAATEYHSFPVVARWLRIFHGASAVLPLWNGTDGLSAGNVTDGPGIGGYVGVTFDTPATRKTTGVSPDVMDHALAMDVDEWSEWARGDVYGWIIQSGTVDEDDEITWREADVVGDSCWGFIGEWYARESARVALDDFIRAYDTDHPGSDEDDELQLAELAAVSTL